MNHFDKRSGLMVYCMGESETSKVDGGYLWWPISSMERYRISPLLPWSPSDCHYRLCQRFPEHFDTILCPASLCCRVQGMFYALRYCVWTGVLLR